jgi:hypothetical protein
MNPRAAARRLLRSALRAALIWLGDEVEQPSAAKATHAPYLPSSQDKPRGRRKRAGRDEPAAALPVKRRCCTFDLEPGALVFRAPGDAEAEERFRARVNTWDPWK